MDTRTKPMIFIVGNSRSGTTMLGRILGKRTDVHTFGELHYFEKIVSIEDMRPGVTWSKEKLQKAAERMLTSMREGLFAAVKPNKYTSEASEIIGTHSIKSPMSLYSAVLAYEANKKNKQIPCEQTPYYLFAADEIIKAFPKAHIIHIYRDPRDVMLSQKNRWKRGYLGDKPQPWIWVLRSWCNYHPHMTSRIWASVIKKSEELRGHARYFELSYEDLLQNPESKLRSVCKHLGVPYEADMLDVEQVGSSERQDVPNKRGLDTSRIGRWKHGGLAPIEIEICEKNAGHAMKSRNYALSGQRSSLLMRIWAYLTLGIKGFLAVILNASRFRNIFSMIRRRV